MLSIGKRKEKKNLRHLGVRKVQASDEAKLLCDRLSVSVFAVVDQVPADHQNACLFLTATCCMAGLASLHILARTRPLLSDGAQFEVLSAGLTLLLSLRFMALVFEEVRNLALGLAARGVKWNSLGPAGGLQILIRLTGRLFANLMQRSVSIAEAMCARGFVGSTQHHLYLTRTQPSSMTANVLAMMLLILLGLGVRYV